VKVGVRAGQLVRLADEGLIPAAWLLRVAGVDAERYGCREAAHLLEALFAAKYLSPDKAKQVLSNFAEHRGGSSRVYLKPPSLDSYRSLCGLKGLVGKRGLVISVIADAESLLPGERYHRAYYIHHVLFYGFVRLMVAMLVYIYSLDIIINWFISNRSSLPARPRRLRKAEEQPVTEEQSTKKSQHAEKGNSRKDAEEVTRRSYFMNPRERVQALLSGIYNRVRREAPIEIKKLLEYDVNEFRGELAKRIAHIYAGLDKLEELNMIEVLDEYLEWSGRLSIYDELSVSSIHRSRCPVRLRERTIYRSLRRLFILALFLFNNLSGKILGGDYEVVKEKLRELCPPSKQGLGGCDKWVEEHLGKEPRYKISAELNIRRKGCSDALLTSAILAPDYYVGLFLHSINVRERRLAFREVYENVMKDLIKGGLQSLVGLYDGYIPVSSTRMNLLEELFRRFVELIKRKELSKELSYEPLNVTISAQDSLQGIVDHIIGLSPRVGIMRVDIYVVYSRGFTVALGLNADDLRARARYPVQFISVDDLAVLSNNLAGSDVIVFVGSDPLYLLSLYRFVYENMMYRGRLPKPLLVILKKREKKRERDSTKFELDFRCGHSLFYLLNLVVRGLKLVGLLSPGASSAHYYERARRLADLIGDEGVRDDSLLMGLANLANVFEGVTSEGAEYCDRVISRIAGTAVEPAWLCVWDIRDLGKKIDRSLKEIEEQIESLPGELELKGKAGERFNLINDAVEKIRRILYNDFIIKLHAGPSLTPLTRLCKEPCDNEFLEGLRDNLCDLLYLFEANAG
jgi:hypothetical protein